MAYHCPYLFMAQSLKTLKLNAKLKDVHQEQLLLHQLLARASKQSVITESCGDLETAVEHTRLLLTLNEQDASAHKIAALTTQAHEVDQLREQVTKLTKQVAALSKGASTLNPNSNQFSNRIAQCEFNANPMRIDRVHTALCRTEFMHAC